MRAVAGGPRRKPLRQTGALFSNLTGLALGATINHDKGTGRGGKFQRRTFPLADLKAFVCLRPVRTITGWMNE